MFPIQKLVLPKDMAQISNGEVPANLLGNIKPYGQVHHKAARCWEAMRQAALADGLTLSHVGALRTLKEQQSLFKQRYSLKDEGRTPTITRKYQGKTWYLKKNCSPAGTPGTSKHGFAVAIDVCAVINKKNVGLGSAPKHVAWLKKNAEIYGWSWQIADPRNPEFEIWHMICFDADNPPPAVTETTLSVPVATKVKRPTLKEKKGKKA
jgi:LAS superfamily LD-carboxypeptidase LdcB